MSVMIHDTDSEDSSIEELDTDTKPIRAPPRAPPKPVFTERSTLERAKSPTSILSLNGDGLCSNKCIDTYSNSSANKEEKFPSVVPLNVGGIKYVTRLSTLRKYDDSMLAALFSGRYKVDKDIDGNYFLDSNGILFGYLLEFLRTGLIPPKEQAVSLLREASYYGLQELVEKIQFMPPVVSLLVKEAHKSQFPHYDDTKEEVIKLAMENATFTKIGEVILYVFKTEFKARATTFNPNHGCIIESAHIKIGPWDAPVDEEVFIKCLENDLIDDGFSVKPHEQKKKCRYYHGQSCPKFVYRLQIYF